MLEENRSQFEALFRSAARAAPGVAESAAAPQPPAATPPAQEPGSARPATDSGAAVDVAPSDVVRFLDDRYGGGWRYEVAERRQEGDEIIVLCKLIVDDQDISKSQFGSARIARPAAGAEVSGTAGGFRFAIPPREPGRALPGSDPEEAAFREALGDALAKCAAML